MRGQNTLIRMRCAGYKPARVWLLVLDQNCPKAFFLDAERVVPNGGQAELHVGLEDNPASLDLRALTQLVVLLQGSNRGRVREVYRRLLQFDPKRVIVSGPDFFHDHTPGAVQ